MRHSLLYICLLILGLIVLASCHHDHPSKPTVKRRTVMVYIAAENSLSRFAMDDVREMMRGADAIPSDCRLLLLIDNYSRPPQIYEITQRGDTVHHYTYPEQCSAESDFASDALLRMFSIAPADSYGLVVWSHGSGWLPAVHPGPKRAVIYDDNIDEGGSCNMGVDELADVLAHCPHLDFIMFDACLMQSVEVAYELRHAADYIIASPAEIPGHGATYDRLMPRLFASPFSAEALAKEYYQCEDDYRLAYNCGGVVISVVDTEQLDSLAKVTRRLVDGRMPQVNNAQPYWLFANRGSFPDFYDMLGTMSAFASSDCYDEWRAQLSRAVPYVGNTKYWDTQCNALSSWSGIYSAGRIVDNDSIAGITMFVPDEKYSNAGRKWNDDIMQTSWWTAVYK